MSAAKYFKACYAQLFQTEYADTAPVFNPSDMEGDPVKFKEIVDGFQSNWIEWYNGASAIEQREFDKIAADIDRGITSDIDRVSNERMREALKNYRASGGRNRMKAG